MKKINLGILTLVVASGLTVAHAQKVKKDSVKSKNLDEVVVVAFGKQKKELVLGSNDVIKAEAIEKRPVSNIAQVIEGAVPGIQVISAVGQPGSAPQIRVRGIGSFSLSNDPLYIIDGVPSSEGLSGINPDDIEAINVLKDAASTSLYGSSAANGVIMITTKSGKANKEEFKYSTSVGFSTRAYPEYDMVSNPMDYYKLTWEGIRNGRISTLGQSNRTISPDDAGKFASLALIKDILYNNIYYIPNTTNDPVHDALYAEYKTFYNTPANQITTPNLPYNYNNIQRHLIILKDGSINPYIKRQIYDDFNWVDAMTQVGIRRNHNVTYSGGANKTNYFFTAAYLNEEGYVRNSDFERISARAKINSEVSTWFKFGANIGVFKTESKQAVDGVDVTGVVNPYRWLRGMAPIYPVHEHLVNLKDVKDFSNPDYGKMLYDANGLPKFEYENPRGTSAVGASGRNAVYENLLNSSPTQTLGASVALNTDIKILKDLNLVLNYGYNVYNTKSVSVRNSILGDAAPLGSIRAEDMKYKNTSFSQVLNYKFNFRRNNFEALVGHENFAYDFENLEASKELQIVSGNPNLVNYVTNKGASGYTYPYRKEGYFTRLNYDYNGTYLLTASLRKDGASRFDQEKRWGTFYAVGAGWLMHKTLFKNSTKVNFLKLRASYGEVGNDGGFGFNSFSAFPDRDLYSLDTHNANFAGIIQNVPGNRDITWESNFKYDVALEAKLFNNRITASLEYFYNISKDMIFNKPLQMNAGVFTNINKRNLGTMYNAGVEAAIKFEIIKKKDYNWDFSFNATHYQNKITEVPQENKKDGIPSGIFRIKEGYSRYDYYTRQWLGVNPDTGRGMYLADDNAVSATIGEKDVFIYGDKKVTINPNKAKLDYTGDTSLPDFNGGFSNYFRYKNWSLNTVFTYQWGGKMYDSNYRAMMISKIAGQSVHVDLFNAWKKVGDQTDVPKLDNSVIGSDYDAQESSRWLIDSSYLNFRSATLNYAFSDSIIEDLGIKNLDLYVNAENIWMFSARKGLDPTQSINGAVFNRYDPARIISFGMNIKF